jgi:hypothetical protein
MNPCVVTLKWFTCEIRINNSLLHVTSVNYVWRFWLSWNFSEAVVTFQLSAWYILKMLCTSFVAVFMATCLDDNKPKVKERSLASRAEVTFFFICVRITSWHVACLWNIDHCTRFLEHFLKRVFLFRVPDCVQSRNTVMPTVELVLLMLVRQWSFSDYVSQARATHRIWSNWEQAFGWGTNPVQLASIHCHLYLSLSVPLFPSPGCLSVPLYLSLSICLFYLSFTQTFVYSFPLYFFNFVSSRICLFYFSFFSFASFYLCFPSCVSVSSVVLIFCLLPFV